MLCSRGVSILHPGFRYELVASNNDDEEEVDVSDERVSEWMELWEVEIPAPAAARG